jgi:hypothetical protein
MIRINGQQLETQRLSFLYSILFVCRALPAKSILFFRFLVGLLSEAVIFLPGILCWLRIGLVHEAGLRDNGLHDVVEGESLVARGLDVDVDEGYGEGEGLAAGGTVQGRAEGEVIGARVAAAVNVAHLPLLHLNIHWCCVIISTLIKKIIKFSSYVRKFRRIGCKVIYD